MRGDQERIEAAGAELTFVGSSRPAAAAEFKREKQLEARLLVDPELAAYGAFGLKRSVRSSLGLKSVKHAWRAFREGHRQESVKGDPWQQGGVFVLAPDGEGGAGQVLYAYRSAEAGDHPPNEEWLAVLERAAPAPA